ncbi:Sodium- and chloride-dependent GABA transporter 1 [Rhodotorula sphaerocarpa]
MHSGEGPDSDVCFSDFIDESAYHTGIDARPGGSASARSPLAAAASAAASSTVERPAATGDTELAATRTASTTAATASTPSASTASTDSPPVFDAPSPFGQAESALTSAPASPPGQHTAATPPPASKPQYAVMDPNHSVPEGYDQFAAAWQAHQQALAFHTEQAAALQAAAIAAAAAGHPFNLPPASSAAPATSPFAATFPQHSYPSSLPPLPASAYYGAQAPHEWGPMASLAQAQAQGYSGTTTPVTGPGIPPVVQPLVSSPSAANLPMQSLHQLGQATSPVADPSLYALHASLDMQARLAAFASMGPPPVPSHAASAAASADHLAAQAQLFASASPSPSAYGGAGHMRSPSGSKGKTALRSLGKVTTNPQNAQRSRTARGGQQGSPLASPAMTPSSHDFAAHASTASSGMNGGAPTASTHQRPLPAMPPGRIDTSTPLASTSAALSPNGSASYASMPARPSALGLSSATTSASSSRQQSPQPSVVETDFLSLEQELDRFSSAGGFASAAAAAIASVSPTSANPALPGTGVSAGVDSRPNGYSRPHDAYGVGGYGGAPTPRLEPGTLPSPRVLTDVLGESVVFPPPGSAKGSSPAQSASVGTGSVGHSPAGAGGGSVGSSAADKSAGFVPSPSSSPNGYPAFDEEAAEALSRKDPIAAQVWRMFHKAKNTMPNGARMENLTWRLMSMSLKKRKDDGGSASSVGGGSASASVQSTPAPQTIPSFAELAEKRSAALPANVSAPSSNAPSPGTEARRAEEEEGRDTVQPLESVGAPSGRMRAARERERERLSTFDARLTEPDAAAVAEHEEEERGRRRRGRADNLSKSASATPESEEQTDDVMDWRALSKSRSRSRAPDMMDWRGQSRSRSRAPDFRVAAAPPAVDSTNAMANFSRFFNDASLPSPIPEQDGSPLNLPLEGQTGGVGAQQDVVDLPAARDVSSAALAELATSLGLSPQDQAELFGSAAARFAESDLLDPQPTTTMPSPTSALHSAIASPTNGSTPHAFAFPSNVPSPNGNGPDPNLAAIESTLNHLISLHHLSTPSPTAPGTAETAEPSPSAPDSATPPATQATEEQEDGGQAHSESLSSAQQHLQQFISGRKASATSVRTGSSASSSRRVSASTSSPYNTATALAQGARPFPFGAAANAAAAAAATTTSSSPASGLSLARPPHVSPQESLPTTPYVETGLPAFLSGSAPTSALFGSPEASAYGSHGAAAHSMYDYFNSAYQAAPHLVNQHLDTFGSAPASVDPSQLLTRSIAPSSISSEPSSWGISSHSLGSSATGAISPFFDEDGQKKSLAKATKRPTGARSTSASSLPTLPNKGKTQSASRASSRSNTISLPSTIKEGQPFEQPTASASAQPDSIPVDSTSTQLGEDVDDGTTTEHGKSIKKLAANGEPLKCINCQTENTPLWRRAADGTPLCNACGLFRNLHGVDRPAKLNTGVIKKRNRTRAPKDTNKKSNRARRNSAAAAEPSTSASTSRKDRAVAGAPYPNAAARAAQHQTFDETV